MLSPKQFKPGLQWQERMDNKIIVASQMTSDSARLVSWATAIVSAMISRRFRNLNISVLSLKNFSRLLTRNSTKVLLNPFLTVLWFISYESTANLIIFQATRNILLTSASRSEQNSSKQSPNFNHSLENSIISQLDFKTMQRWNLYHTSYTENTVLTSQHIFDQ